MSTFEILFPVYFIIGAILSCYWWKKDYADNYKKAKQSKEGVEEGMVAILLSVLFIFWPLVLIYKIVRKIVK